jgi:hypothetical protein
MKYLEILKIVFAMLPVIHAIVDQIEELFPQGGYGALKLAMIKDMLQKAMEASDIGGTVFNTLWPMLSGVIANVVAIKKATKKAEVVLPVNPSDIVTVTVQ